MVVSCAIAVQPPARARAREPLYPPLSARLRSDQNLLDDLGNYSTCVTLLHYTDGEALYNTLDGKLWDCSHPMPYIARNSPLATAYTNAPADGLRDRAYYFYDNLVIKNPGTYRIRLTFMGTDYSPEYGPHGIHIVLQQIDSRLIIVDDPGLHYAKPSKCSKDTFYGRILTNTGDPEKAFLNILREAGEVIPGDLEGGSSENQGSNSANNAGSGSGSSSNR